MMFLSSIYLTVVLVLALHQVSGEVAPRCDNNICRVEQELMKAIKELRGEVANNAKIASSCTPCPPGFIHKPEVNACYKVILEALTWEQSQERCRKEAPGSHLVDVGNASKDRVIIDYLRTLSPKEKEVCKSLGSPGFYTSGRRRDGDCSKEYVWSPKPGAAIPLTYTNWNGGQPDCAKFAGFQPEACIHYWDVYGFNWNDMSCERTMCAVCEVDK